jgi:hypothetical protein
MKDWEIIADNLSKAGWELGLRIGRTSARRAGRQSMVGRLHDLSEPQLW